MTKTVVACFFGPYIKLHMNFNAANVTVWLLK